MPTAPLTSDGLRTFDYDASGRLAKVRVLRDGEPATVSYLHNALGQRVFKGEPESEFEPPREEELGRGFTAWLRQNFAWLFTSPHDKGSLGQAFVYGAEVLPAWALLGEYDNGTRAARGTSEYIWLPTGDGGVIPVGMYRNGTLYAMHTDHLGTPRVVTDEKNKPVWQWPYLAFGNNEPIGWVTGSSEKAAGPVKPVKPLIELNLRFPGQYADAETGLAYNLNRSYLAGQGRYGQSDPLGLVGGLNEFAYGEGNPLTKVDPLGLATFTLTGGGSAVVVGGREGSVGIYFSNKPNDIGIVVSGGAGVGRNVGLSAPLGYVPGPLSNVSGNTRNYNASCVIGSGTWMTDPKTGAFAGASIGPAGRLGMSATNAETRTWGLRDAFDRLFNKLGGIQ